MMSHISRHQSHAATCREHDRNRHRNRCRCRGRSDSGYEMAHSECVRIGHCCRHFNALLFHLIVDFIVSIYLKRDILIHIDSSVCSYC